MSPGTKEMSTLPGMAHSTFALPCTSLAVSYRHCLLQPAITQLHPAPLSATELPFTGSFVLGRSL